MVTLEQLAPGSIVRGVIADEAVTVIDIRRFGKDAIELTFRAESTGRPDSRILDRSDETALELVERGRAWAYDADGARFRLVMEAQRIRLAYLFDPQFAVSASQIDPLPHQIDAVYNVMLRRQPLRFLLADDPGAGKTVMAGLLIKELMLRGDVRRCLIVVPAALDVQWQDELWEKFALRFDLMGRDKIEGAVGNPFEEQDLSIARIDLLKQDENLERLRQVEWDLVIVDEAHKMSANFRSGTTDVQETARYRLGQELSRRARHFLLMTATPHRGKEEDFQLFLALLDPDRFEGRFRAGVHRADPSDVMRRMLKEDLLDFEGRKLFPERRSHTLEYTLSDDEAELYAAVTRYVRDEMSRADRVAQEEGGVGQRRRVVIGFALTVLQRRLASSPEAIFRSLTRRRERLERTLAEERERRQTAESARRSSPSLDLLGAQTRAVRNATLEDLEADLDERPEGETDELVDLASAARTIAEVEHEIERLIELEDLARIVRDAPDNAKWRQMRELLQDNQMFDPQGRRRKLVIFTEHRDTLNYLARQIRRLLGDEAAVVTIHGGLGRDERRAAQSAFVNDPGALVLVATDAAGEGINLQRANLMVNYDLPWNPNRLEQRFGRIHRFNQREVCHNWNLVAAGTREGDVYRTLFRKLEEAREALGGKVFDVLGQLFSDHPLRDLMLEAIRYGDDPARRADLERVVNATVGLEQYREAVQQHVLAREAVDVRHLDSLREDRERIAINRLVPHFIAAFFLEAFRTLGGTVQEREEGRYQITGLPAELLRRGQEYRRGTVLQRRYERICFDRTHVQVEGRPRAEIVAPGHPLLEVTIDLLLERDRELLRRGAVLVDPRAGADRARALFTLRNDVTDDRPLLDGTRQIASSELHFVEVGQDGEVAVGNVAPYLDYRPLEPDEHELLRPLLDAPWLRESLADQAQAHAIEHLVPAHFARVKRDREEWVHKTEDAVRERLTREITWWDHRAETLRDEERAGRQPKMNADRARRTADELTARLRARLRELERERRLARQAPIVIAGAVVIPQSMIAALRGAPEEQVRAREVRRIEAIAMRETIARERAAGYEVRDVSAENVGYDLEAIHPEMRALRLIEVKGRDSRGGTVTLTRNEQLVARNKGAAYILAIVEVAGEEVTAFHAIPDPLGRETDDHLPFGMVAATFDIAKMARVNTAG